MRYSTFDSACVLGIVLAISGCGGGKGLPRLPVYGRVTSGPTDSVSGMISFLPEEGTKGPAATASLLKGKYQFDHQTGPVAGKYNVLVVEDGTALKGKTLQSGSIPSEASASLGEWNFRAEVSAKSLEFNFNVADVPKTSPTP